MSSDSTNSQSKYDDAYFENAISNMSPELQEIMNPNKPVKSYLPVKIELPNPSEPSVVACDKEGKPKCLDRTGCILYLRNCNIIQVGTEFRRFDGRVFSPITEKDMGKLIKRASWACNSFLYVPTKPDVANVIEACDSLMPDHIDPFIGDVDMSDYDGEIMAFQNGIFNFTTQKMLPFSPFLSLFHYMRADYNPMIKDAPARSIIEGIVPNPETRQALFEIIGYILFSPTLNPPAIFIFYGPSETGKSALAKMIETLIGTESVAHLDMSVLTDKFGPANMENKWLNICSETGSQSSKVTHFDGELLKKMSSGEKTTVQHKHGQLYEIIPTAKVLFCTNTQPDFGDDSSGMLRRLKIIPCRQPQDSKRQIHDLLTTPESLSWVINKAREAYELFKANGKVFTVSEEMSVEKSYFKAQNSLNDFLQTVFNTDDKNVLVDKLVEDEELRYTAQFYAHYQEFCKMTGSQAMGRKRVTETMRNEYNLNIVQEGIYFEDHKHTTRTRYAKRV